MFAHADRGVEEVGGSRRNFLTELCIHVASSAHQGVAVKLYSPFPVSNMTMYLTVWDGSELVEAISRDPLISRGGSQRWLVDCLRTISYPFLKRV